MIDKTSLANPDITQILQTCKYKKNMSTHQVLVKSKFADSYRESSKKGVLSNRLQEAMGVFSNKNHADEPICHYSDCKSYQQSKSLSHIFQHDQQVAASFRIFVKAMEKEAEDQSKLVRIYHSSNDATSILLSLVPCPEP